MKHEQTTETAKKPIIDLAKLWDEVLDIIEEKQTIQGKFDF